MSNPTALPTCSITTSASQNDSVSLCDLTREFHPNSVGNSTVCPRLEIGNSSVTPLQQAEHHRLEVRERVRHGRHERVADDENVVHREGGEPRGDRRRFERVAWPGSP